MGEKILILGAGESGIGAAVLAATKGYSVFVSSASEIKPQYVSLMSDYGMHWEEGRHSRAMSCGDYSEVIKSPGIPEKSELMKAVRKTGVPVISEIEFASRYTKAKIVGITGSNGKTTTTLLTHHILKNGGLNVGLAGNVGKSFAMSVAKDNYDYYVIELSSFQLDDIKEFRPNISILTNITPDHLDRYDYKYENYIRSKFRIGMNQKGKDVFIYCADDPDTMTWFNELAPSCVKIPFSHEKEFETGGFVKENEIVIKTKNKVTTMSINELALQGKHNRYNSLAAGLVANVYEIRKDIIRESLMSFTAVEHRMEKVIKVHGVEFINDSKATNVNSTWYALESMKNQIVWIAGGVDKGNDYEPLFDLVKEKVKGMVFLGVDNKKLFNSFKWFEKPKSEATNMKDAVRLAYKMARPGDIVLLSPACASFDLFENFEDRGIQFKKSIREL